METSTELLAAVIDARSLIFARTQIFSFLVVAADRTQYDECGATALVQFEVHQTPMCSQASFWIYVFALPTYYKTQLSV